MSKSQHQAKQRLEEAQAFYSYTVRESAPVLGMTLMTAFTGAAIAATSPELKMCFSAAAVLMGGLSLKQSQEYAWWRDGARNAIKEAKQDLRVCQQAKKSETNLIKFSTK